MPAITPALSSTGRKSPLAFFGLVVTVGLWWAASETGVIDPLVLPSPVRVWAAAVEIGSDLFIHIASTIARVVVGYMVGAAGGLIVGAGMQYSRAAYVALDGLVEAARPVPPVALVPFFILVFGFNEIGKILLVASGTGLVVAVTVIEALERVSPGVVRWGILSGVSRTDLFSKVLLPAALPEMRAGFRISLAGAITLVVVAEFMGASSGLGYLLSVAKVTLSTPTIILCTTILGWISYLFDLLLRYAFHTFCGWDARAGVATR